MPSKNVMVLEGHLGGDPEIKYLSDGTPLCTLSAAENYGKKDNRKTQWHRIVVWGDLAEAVANSFKKGDAIQVEGPYRSRKWQTSDGEDRETWEITAYSVRRPLYPKKTKESQPMNPELDHGDPIEDDIPF